jgi:hypothetical protein
MKRWLTTGAILLICSAALHADITIVQTTTVEGGMAAMAAASGSPISPKTTTRIRGMKSRTDIEAGPINVSTMVDLDTKQVIILRPDQKTATIIAAGAPAASGQTPAPTTTGPTIEASIKPTGKTQVVDGVKLEEYSFANTMDMSSMGGAQMPPEALAAMQGMKMAMTGSMWIAKDVPGAGEYLAFQKAASASDIASVAASASGMNIPGMDKMMKAMAAASGLTYLTEMTVSVEGTGPMADMMRQMGPMKITTKVSSVKNEAVGEDVFKVPEGYTVVKQ